MHFIWIGNPDNRRCTSFIQEIEKLNKHSYLLISHQQLLTQSIDWKSLITNDTVIKIDSTGENEEVRKQLIFLGATSGELPLESVITDYGRIAYQEEWYQGFSIHLRKLNQSLQPFKVTVMNSVEDIVVMFDKIKTQEALDANNIPTPRSFTNIKSFEELTQMMVTNKMHQVFIKPAHSSSASGIVAFRYNNTKMKAIAPIQVNEENQDDVILYNSLKVHTYTEEIIVKKIIAEILSKKTIVQQWIPKARYQNKSFDFRVVVIDKKARHIVARMSSSPITNLHLGNERGNLKEIKALLGSSKFKELQDLAEKTAACFPNSLYMGIDILVTSSLKNFKVLEVNAFGDLLPNLIDQGENVYQAQILTAIQKWQ